MITNHVHVFNRIVHSLSWLSLHHLGRVQLLGTVESNLWKSSAAAVWAVYDQWMAGSLLQHVRTDLEPARIRNGVSLFCAHFFRASKGLQPVCSRSTALDVCFLRQSQSSGWMGGFGSQSTQAAAPQGPVMSNLGNYNMAGYQTQ